MMDHTLDLADIAEMLPPFDLWTSARAMARSTWSGPPDYIHTSLLDAYTLTPPPAMSDADAIRVARRSPFVLAWMLDYDVPYTPHTVTALCRVFNALQDVTNKEWSTMITAEGKAWIDDVARMMRHACFVYHAWRKSLPPNLSKRAPRAGERNLNWTSKRAW